MLLGPRRIFTNEPVDIKENQPHVIQFGRYGRRAWLKVDHFENITGRSPGKLVHLDVIPIIYLGQVSLVLLKYYVYLID